MFQSLWERVQQSSFTPKLYFHNHRSFFVCAVSPNSSLPLPATMGPAKIEYPVLKEDPNVIDDYHGTKIADPFRWLEKPDSEEVTKFVEVCKVSYIVHI